MFISSQIKHLNNIYYILITFFLHLLNIPILKSYHPTIMLDFSYRQSCFAVLVKMKKVLNTPLPTVIVKNHLIIIPKCHRSLPACLVNCHIQNKLYRLYPYQ